MEVSRLIDENQIHSSFKKIIKASDNTIVLYSGIWSFINKISFKKNISKKILDIIEEIVTPNRTLIIPSFSAETFLKNNNFDIKNSFDKNNGVIPQEALRRNYYYRTPQPLHSYLVFGKKINEIKNLKFKTSWGKTSLLEWMSKQNSRICVLGIPWNKGCSYLHRFEEKYKVPWRYFKTFKGNMYENGKYKGNCTENKYSSPILVKLNYNFLPFIKELKKKKVFLNGSNKFLIKSTTANQIDEVGNVFFSGRLKWNIIKNPKAIKNWINNKKKLEIKI